MSSLVDIVDRFRDRRVGVIGDLIADVYLYARPSRLSREAPIIVVDYEREETIPGGAANTVRNLVSLGARATLLGEVGDDAPGQAVLKTLREEGVNCERVNVVPGRASVTKTRVLAGEVHRTKQQLFRIDRDPQPGAQSDEAAVVAALQAVDHEVEGWIVSDYDYGFLNPRAIEWLRKTAERKPVVVDSRHRMGLFGGVSVLTPNEEEAEEAIGMRIAEKGDAEALGRALQETLRVESVLLTRGKRGMMLFRRGEPMVSLPIVGTEDVVDVSGAGDTVVAAFTMAMLAGAVPVQAAWIANCTASVVVMKLGASACSQDELREVLLAEQPDA